MKVAIFAVISLLLISCSLTSSDQIELSEEANDLWQHPSPQPSYITNMYVSQSAYCLDIDLRFFTGQSFTSPDIGLDDLIDKIRFAIDGDNLEFNSLGSDRYIFFACFLMNSLSEDVHIADPQLIRFDGTEAEYRWAFQVVNNTSSLIMPPNFPPTQTPSGIP